MGYKLNCPPRDVYGFVNPSSVDGGVETLEVTLSCLINLRMVNIVAEIKANCIALSLKSFLRAMTIDVWVFWGEVIKN